jgi:hypothetical protein
VPILDAAQYEVQGVLAGWNLSPWLDHLSPSSLSMLRRCPRQFQERYIHGRKERPGEAPVVGSAVHKGLERNFAQKIESHVDIPTHELTDWFMDEGFARTALEEQENSGFEIYWDTDPDAARLRGRNMLGEYHNQVSPRLQPLGVEGSVSVDFGLPVPIVGRYDLDRESSTIDWKTGRRAKRKPQESWRIQAAVYGEATGKPVEFHSISATEKTNAVTIVTPLEADALFLQPTVAERAQIRETIRAIGAEAVFYMSLYGPDEAWPTHGRFHDWACGFCGYRNDCPAWEDL